jgi:hypothetical protein
MSEMDLQIMLDLDLSADARSGTANASISGSPASDGSRTASGSSADAELRTASGSSADAEPRTASGSSADAETRTASEDSPSLSTTINPSINPATVATSVRVVRSAAMINHTDLIAEANRFLKNLNIQDKIILTLKILHQQVEINFEASDIS